MRINFKESAENICLIISRDQTAPWQSFINSPDYNFLHLFSNKLANFSYFFYKDETFLSAITLRLIIKNVSRSQLESFQQNFSSSRGGKVLLRLLLLIIC